MEIMGYTISMTIFWLAVGIVFAVVEGLTMGLVTIWFTGGALVAFIAALFGANITVQVILFFVVSVVLLYFTRKIFNGKLHTGEEKTNVNALIGEEAIVTTAIEPFKTGQIKLKGQQWTAISVDNQQRIPVDKIVMVKSIEGVKAIVEPLDDEGIEKL